MAAMAVRLFANENKVIVPRTAGGHVFAVADPNFGGFSIFPVAMEAARRKVSDMFGAAGEHYHT